ncbi:apoptosis-inducing factor 2 isoform X1 [Oncorhynchus mykiss]|uniref:apoptosis-inducing factor 2 isoform X1 n=1 Tax=Oncorhynchus mykiss TaxID=8022 RepID=UPI000B4F7361|nr:apoptosis-inducing factor 2 isoform X1 [Oncorhynchus mykiss]
MGSQVSVDNVHVVVVGGGFGGTAAAQQLKSRGIPFTLIDLRDAFHHNVAALRAAVQSGFAQQTFIPYLKTFGENFLQGRVIWVDPVSQTVALDGGKEVHYSHLILCTGTDGPFPGKYNMVASYQTAIQKYEDIVKEVQAAGSVLVVGGGSTGVEMAAEIKTEYPDKKVILIHSRVGLADPELLPSVRQQAKEVLLEKGVELLLDGCLAENGSLKVNVHLQVEGYDNVYAVGDCANVNEPKMAYHAGLHAGVAVANITNSLMGKHLESYHPGSVTMLLAMGHNDGVGQFNGLRLPRCLVTQGKSKNLLLWKSWKEMGQKAP